MWTSCRHPPPRAYVGKRSRVGRCTIVLGRVAACRRRCARGLSRSKSNDMFVVCGGKARLRPTCVIRADAASLFLSNRQRYPTTGRVSIQRFPDESMKFRGTDRGGSIDPRRVVPARGRRRLTATDGRRCTVARSRRPILYAYHRIQNKCSLYAYHRIQAFLFRHERVYYCRRWKTIRA